MKVVVGQFAAGIDRVANIDGCVALIGRAASEGADLVILPEVAHYFDPRHQGGPGPHGEAVDGPFARAIRAAAKRHGVAVIVGMLEAAPGDGAAGGRDYNTLLAVSADGELTDTYRKIHLYDAFGFKESDIYLPGDIGRPAVVEVAGARVGLATCYDLRFPEVFRWLADAGVDVVALPAAWIAGPGKEAHWQTLLQARAIENTFYLAGAGQTGPVCCGHSMIVDPAGAVLAGAGLAPGLAIAEVDRARIDEVRATNPSLANRRFSVIPAR
jgi:predicted amidohydrolase